MYFYSDIDGPTVEGARDVAGSLGSRQSTAKHKFERRNRETQEQYEKVLQSDPSSVRGLKCVFISRC